MSQATTDRYAPDSWRIAAKFASTTYTYHPLICHMLDVAAVAHAIWRHCLAGTLRERVAEAFQLEESCAERWVAFLAACHDLGKATPVFQAKGSTDRQSTPPWLHSTSLTFERLGNRRDPGHGTVTAATLPDILSACFGLDSPVATRLAVITGGHHGIFPTAAERKNVNHATLGEPKAGRPNPWDEARRELVKTVADLLRVEGKPASPSNAASMVLAGLISVVDWIGSIDHQEYFPYAPDGLNDLATYFEERKKRAGQVVKRLHWDAWPHAGMPRSFKQLFPNLGPPRPLQLAVERDLARDAPPALVVIEAPMGEGKTEAAFYLAEGWNASGLRGSYIAMPTQATSNQLYERYKEFLARRYRKGEKVNVQLLHGHASLSAAVKLLDDGDFTHGPSDIDASGERGEATVGAAEWFTYRKRGLLAPFGVGTIDQALLSVLQVRHGFVRLFGLAGKTVIIDEVHAYDTYMSTLLERLLEWLAALGSPVVLLSATLPRAKRTDLLNAYRRGLGVAEEDPPADRYPRITRASRSEVGGRSIKASGATRRTLALGWLDGGIDQLPKHLLQQLRDGGCAAVVCNTVHRAQEVYLALRKEFGARPEAERPELDLFHARFLYKDRQEREKRCLRRFGKPDQADGTTAARPRRAVLVATQVIEQSLDLDFDVMVTEMAPIDLLLQRAGRVCRHQRQDRRGPGSPVLKILAPETDEDGLPAFERGTTFVYDEHILLRTWHALRDVPSIAIPEDVERLVEAVYGESNGPPDGAPETLVERWKQTYKVMQEKRERERQEALSRRIPSPSGSARLEDHTRDPREEDAPDLHPALQALTRLTDLSVQVVLCPQGNGERFGLVGDQPPAQETCREILGHSVTVTAPDVANKLLGVPVPRAWQRSGLLRRLRMLELDAANECRLDGITLRYSAELGLVVDRPETFD
jgi:CRISPR-associated endonuclease/helicase Cas3